MAETSEVFMDDQAQTQNPSQQDAPAIRRRFLTVEIQGGDPRLVKIAREMLQLNLKTTILFIDCLHGHRKGAPTVILHDTEVNA
jgi:hypothetical protein